LILYIAIVKLIYYLCSRKIKDLLNVSLWNNLEKKKLFRGRSPYLKLVPQAKASKTTTSLYHSGPFATDT